MFFSSYKKQDLSVLLIVRHGDEKPEQLLPEGSMLFLNRRKPPQGNEEIFLLFVLSFQQTVHFSRTFL